MNNHRKHKYANTKKLQSCILDKDNYPVLDCHFCHVLCSLCSVVVVARENMRGVLVFVIWRRAIVVLVSQALFGFIPVDIMRLYFRTRTPLCFPDSSARGIARPTQSRRRV